MKNNLQKLTCFFILLVTVTTAYSQDYFDYLVEEVTETETGELSEIQNRYLNFLDENGYDGWVDSDGDVQFDSDRFTYCIFSSDQSSDEAYFRIGLLNIWPIESEEERIQALEAMDAVNKEMKVCKLFTVEDNIWVNFEVLLNDQDDYEGFFERAITIMDTSANLFADYMQ